jgi:hypothetical protein
MTIKIRKIWQRPFLRYLFFQSIFIGGMAVVAHVLEFDFGSGIFILGAIITMMPFMSAHAPITSYGVMIDHATQNEINQSIERFHKRMNLFLVNVYTVTGVPLMILGVVFMMV